jgi:hypothetical protein
LDTGEAVPPYKGTDGVEAGQFAKERKKTSPCPRSGLAKRIPPAGTYANAYANQVKFPRLSL